MNVETEQGSAEWHAHRHGRLTASLFAAAIGHHPHKTRQKLYREMVGLNQPFGGNAATSHGTKHEPAARAAYEVRAGVLVDEVGFCMHPLDRWLGASADGVIEPGGYLEIKCPYGGGSPALYTEPPAYYLPQVQGGLYVTGRDWADFVCYVPPTGAKPGALAIWRIERSEPYIETLVAGLRDFWVYVVRRAGEPPGKRAGFQPPDLPPLSIRETYRGTIP